MNKKNTIYHLGIIPDGNRRWARGKNMPTLLGHKKGYEVAMDTVVWAKKRGVKVITIWGFSTENWNRDKKEIDYLMKLLGRAISKKNISKLNKEGIRVRVIGEKQMLPKDLQQRIKEVENETKNNKEIIFNFAMSYGGRAELVNVIKSIVKDKIQPNKINQQTIENYLYTKNQPGPDVIIRTSGEYRLSGFLTWQGVYSELFFLQKHWPDFDEEDLDNIILEYSNRKRRFGK